MVQISDKPVHDPIAAMKMVDAYMRWALEASEEVIGKDGLAVVLRGAGLERFIDNYPPNVLETSGNITYGDYTALCAGILNFFGRPGKSMVMRIGRLSAKKAIEHQSGIFNLATVLAGKLLPTSVQVKMGLGAVMGGFKVMAEKAGQEFKGTIEDKGDTYHYVVETCPLCSGKQADSNIGWLMEASLEEGLQQVFNKFFDVVEVECKAKGAPAGIWEVPKQPGEEGVNRSAR